MSGVLIVRRAGPQMTVQDLGRPGYLSRGLSRGGAADRLALLEGAKLLGQRPLAAVEMAGLGGVFEASAEMTIALTGAEMDARSDGNPLKWNATHVIPQGARVEIGAARRGVYGYLSVAGGIATEPVLGSRSVHLAAGIGAPLAEGDSLPVGDGAGPKDQMAIRPEDRLSGGVVRVAPGAQTGWFPEAERARFEETAFRRAPAGNRQGVTLDFDGAGFAAEGQKTVLSEPIIPGDIQMTGDGKPVVLLSECQTTGGYPRIGSVVAVDLPRVAQAAPGAKLTFRFVTTDEARALWRDEAELLKKIRPEPLRRDPATIPDLLAYQLISGVVSGEEAI